MIKFFDRKMNSRSIILLNLEDGYVDALPLDTEKSGGAPYLRDVLKGKIRGEFWRLLPKYSECT